MNWKGYISVILLCAAIVFTIESCEDMKGSQPRKPATTPRITPVPQSETKSDPDNMYCYVNEYMYQNICEAKRNFEQLLQNGDVAQRLRSNGCSVSHEEAEALRSNINNGYDTICRYVKAYESKDYKSCYQYGVSLCDYYSYAFGRSALYNLMVAPVLPSGYQDSIDNSNPYDGNGNIRLRNGNKIRLLGNNDDLIAPDTTYNDEYTSAYFKSEWLTKVPGILSDYYCTIQNTDGNDGVCCVVNRARAERYCSGEFAAIKEERFGYNAKDVRILPSGSGYIFRGPDEEDYGSLTDSQVNRVNGIYTVQDALVSGSGSASWVDYYIDTMSIELPAKQYIIG